MILNILTIFFLTSGLVFFLGAAVGIIRFPDFYTRLHAAGKGDTFSTQLMLVGFAAYNLHHFSLAALLVSLKILIIGVFVFIGSPTASHAIMDAGYSLGIKPWKKKPEGEGKPAP